ncbi:hypothetical protein EG68_11175 [Paragonimus skrjabini miyazakii]|uniref:Elongation factor Ts, mitochondrial n=1 Tax=Paragonimus skrjabini miyazakii TaxID=59628 RepID=A0A8S9Y9V8_9TREM|nr:hypothetical protein EG68_11175 [Paragonimus skrjabini miyazakii]
MSMLAVVGRSRPSFIATSRHLIRLVSTSVDKSLLSKLRRTTGFTFAACKEALLRHNNDFDKAISWLNEEAVHRGWDKASKVSNRALSHGLLGVLQHRASAVIVEVNCETDFVARNEQFQTFVASLTETVMNEFKSDLPKVTWTAAELNALVLPNASTVSDQTAVVIGSVGENMAVRRGLGWHVPNGSENASRLATFGKYASLIRYRPMGDQSSTPAWRERAARLGKQLCQHIVGMNPRPGLEITEPNANPEEEQCLLLQPFFLDENVRVGEHLMRNDMILEDFIRVECGQDDSTVTCGTKSPNANITSEN